MISDIVKRLNQLGCKVRVDAGRIKVQGKKHPEIPGLLAALRSNRESVIARFRGGGLVTDEIIERERSVRFKGTTARLYQFLFREVRTPLGPGILEQVFSDRVCVRIDDKPKHPGKPTSILHYFSPEDILPPRIM